MQALTRAASERAEVLWMYLTHSREPPSSPSSVEGWTGSIATVVALAAEHVAMWDNVM